MRSQSNSQKAHMGEFVVFIVSYDLFKTRIAPLFANLVIRLGFLKRKHVKNMYLIFGNPARGKFDCCLYYDENSYMERVVETGACVSTLIKTSLHTWCRFG